MNMHTARFKMHTLLTRGRLLFGFCILHFAFCIAVSAREPQSPSQVPPRAGTTADGRADAEKHLATINTYCVSCHNDRAKMGGVSFQGVTAGNIAERGDVFEKAVRK